MNKNVVGRKGSREGGMKIHSYTHTYIERDRQTETVREVERDGEQVAMCLRGGVWALS